MLLVVKRDGENVEYCLEKKTMAIQKAFKATDKFYTDDILELLSIRVTSDFQKKIQENRIAVKIYRTAWRRCWRNPVIPMWPRPTFCTGNSARRSAIWIKPFWTTMMWWTVM